MATKKKTTSASPKSFNLQALLDALPDDARLQDPVIPAKTFAVEAKRALEHANKHKKRLSALPDFDGAVFSVLSAAIPRFELAHRKWDQERNKVASGSGRTSLRKEGEQLRADIIASDRFLFRKAPEGLLELDRIQQGDGVDDLITDLRDLVVFRNDHKARWAQDVKLEKDAFDRIAEIADALEGQVDSERALEAREERNMLAALISTALKEVRDGAAYLFRDDGKRLKPFKSEYQAARRREARKAAKKKAAASNPA